MSADLEKLARIAEIDRLVELNSREIEKARRNIESHTRRRDQLLASNHEMVAEQLRLLKEMTA